MQDIEQSTVYSLNYKQGDFSMALETKEPGNSLQVRGSSSLNPDPEALTEKTVAILNEHFSSFQCEPGQSVTKVIEGLPNAGDSFKLNEISFWSHSSTESRLEKGFG